MAHKYKILSWKQKSDYSKGINFNNEKDAINFRLNVLGGNPKQFRIVENKLKRMAGI